MAVRRSGVFCRCAYDLLLFTDDRQRAVRIARKPPAIGHHTGHSQLPSGHLLVLLGGTRVKQLSTITRRSCRPRGARPLTALMTTREMARGSRRNASPSSAGHGKRQLRHQPAIPSKRARAAFIQLRMRRAPWEGWRMNAPLSRKAYGAESRLDRAGWLRSECRIGHARRTVKQGSSSISPWRPR
jgi:hypothetical protein